MITYLQSIQTAHAVKGNPSGLLGWYNHIRAHHNHPFDWAVFDVSAGLSVRHYSDGISQNKDVPDLDQQFNGHVVGVGEGRQFRALLALGVEGSPLGGSMNAMQQHAHRLGFEIQTPLVIPAGRIPLLLELIDGLDAVLLLPEAPGVAALFGGKNRQCAALVKPVAATPPAPEVHLAPEATVEPLPVEAPKPAPVVMAEKTTSAKPKAIITGGFRYPQEHYKPELVLLGYEVIDSVGVEDLPADVQLVFYPMKNKQTKLVEQALARGVKTMVVTELREAIRTQRLRGGV